MNFLSVPVLFLQAALGAEDGCPRKFPGTLELEAGHRAYHMLSVLLQDIDRKPIGLCVWNEQKYKPEAHICCAPWKTGVVIMLSRYTADNFSDQALLGALAHEVGHTFNPVISEKNIEEKADASAIRLVGGHTLGISYAEQTLNPKLADRRVKEAEKLLKKSQRRR